jgi:hypothetical protein
MDNLLRDLQDAWSRDGESPDAVTAMTRWAEHRPDLVAYATPAHLVRACHTRSDSTAKRLLDELTEEAAADPWAARTVLQALLPGLAGIARRHYDQLVGDGREPFADIGDLDQFLVATAFERITEIAAEVPRFRVRSVLDSTWTRLRAHAAAHRRDWDTLVPLGEATDHTARPERSAAEELAATLVDAVERRVLCPVDAGLVYATRVVGHTTADVAGTLAWRTPSLVRRRHRVERLLAAQVLGQRPPRGCYVAAPKACR